MITALSERMPSATTPSSDPQAELARLRPFAEMGRMAATVAHEIRNPLAGISANVELLRETITDPADRESLDIILGEVQRLGHLVSDLLCYCRERTPEEKPIDLIELARTTAELERPDAEQAGIELTWSGSGMARGDRELSRQALLNIVRNAIQATPRGGRVTILVGERRIEVRDNGHGIPESIRATLFEPFVTGRTRGLGLGATVALRCQQRQHGGLEIVDTGPTGSTFALLWP